MSLKVDLEETGAEEKKEGPVVIKIKFRNPFWYTKGMGVRGVFRDFEGKSVLVRENRMEKISVAKQEIVFHLNDNSFEVKKGYVSLPIFGYVIVNLSAIERIEVLSDNYLLTLFFTNESQDFYFDLKGFNLEGMDRPHYDIIGKTNKCHIAEDQRHDRTSFSWFFWHSPPNSGCNTISCCELQLDIVEIDRIDVVFDIPPIIPTPITPE